MCLFWVCFSFEMGHVPFDLLAAGVPYMYVSILPGYILYVRVHLFLF